MDTNQLNEEPLFPSYKETLEEIGRQMKVKRGAFIRRIALLIWPVWIFVILVYALRWSLESETGAILITSETLSSPWFLYLFYAIILWSVFAFFYYFTISFIFDIEQKVWIDSYFDGRNLDSKSSWRIARRLFFPTMKLAFLTLVRFYLPAIIIILVGAAVPYYTWTTGQPISPEFFILPNAVAWAIATIYCYITHLRLRYLPFFFLFEFNTDTYSYQLLVQKMKGLNRINTKDAIKRVFVSDITTTSFESAVNLLSGILQSQLQKTGKAGQLAGSLLGVTTDVATMQVANFARRTTLYMIYRYTRFKVFNERQKINDYIYKLSER